MNTLLIVLDGAFALTLVYLVVCVESGHRQLLPPPLARWLAKGDES